MKVKLLRGDIKEYGMYEILLQENKEVTDLPSHIQDAVSTLGELEHYLTKDIEELKGISNNKEWLNRFEKDGAILKKINIKFGPSPCVYEMPFTFPPFSELDGIQHNKNMSDTENDTT